MQGKEPLGTNLKGVIIVNQVSILKREGVRGSKVHKRLLETRVLTVNKVKYTSEREGDEYLKN